MKGDYKELKVWNKSMQLAASAYEVARLLPVEEKFALADQIRRVRFPSRPILRRDMAVSLKKSFCSSFLSQEARLLNLRPR